MPDIMHSPMFNKIKHWYSEVVPALWTKSMVYNAVPKMITSDEYEEITGEAYIPGDSEATIKDYEDGMKELGVL